MPRLSLFGLFFFFGVVFTHAAEQPVIPLWAGEPPGGLKNLGAEEDTTKPTDRLVGEKRVMRITNVSTPTLTVFAADPRKANGTAVVVCPGGGHRVLAWDLEGTEVAEWLNSLGVTAFVLKYRVPGQDGERRWLDAVQDAQRAMSLVRSRAGEWRVDPKRIGILGFSAGGETAGLTSIFDQRQYEPRDSVDQVASRPDFAVLVYTGGMVAPNDTKLREHVRVTSQSPPMFLVHAGDDRLSSENSVLLYLELLRAKAPAELHVYASGGHGFGLRPTADPSTTWPARCEQWLQNMRLLGDNDSSVKK
jgi:acetyl esterase/lipase